MLGSRSLARALAALALVGLGACGASQQGPALSYGESARRDYERALGAFQDNDCLTATPLFQHVRREYPYSRYAALAELRSADCELEQQRYSEAIRQYRSFIRARPTHPDLDYAQYRVAVAYFRQIPQDFFLSPPREERDQGPTRSALRVIERFLREHAESEHATETRTMHREVLALLARHELYVADFYLFRDRPRATISRIEGMLHDYQGSGLEPLALVLLGRTYLHMGEPTRARVAFEDVVEHHAQSGFAQQARNFLERMEPPANDAGEPPASSEPPPSRRPAEGDSEGERESVEEETREEETAADEGDEDEDASSGSRPRDRMSGERPAPAPDAPQGPARPTTPEPVHGPS